MVGFCCRCPAAEGEAGLCGGNDSVLAEGAQLLAGQKKGKMMKGEGATAFLAFGGGDRGNREKKKENGGFLWLSDKRKGKCWGCLGWLCRYGRLAEGTAEMEMRGLSCEGGIGCGWKRKG